jgi:Zn-finger nucleic acid-binding protein
LSDSSLRCPGCGAPASVDTAACDYCGAALATVTCPSCFAPMFAGSRFCARCGAEATRDLLEDATPLACPRCSEPLQALRLGATTVRECAAGGGLWVDPSTLQKLSDAREEHAGVTSALAAHAPTSATPPDTVRYIPCPQCAKLMNRVNFARSSGVVMDVCKAHGVWLDRGELQRVVGFVEQGGLSAAREREQLVEERRRLDAAKGAGAAPATEFRGATVTFSSRRSKPDSPIDQVLRDALGLFSGS